MTVALRERSNINHRGVLHYLDNFGIFKHAFSKKNTTAFLCNIEGYILLSVIVSFLKVHYMFF